MKLVATLVSSPRHPSVDNFVIGKAATALETAASCKILAENVAADLLFDGNFEDVKSYHQQIHMPLRDYPVDVIVQPVENRKKKLFLADMDSTIIEQECIDELADFAGFKQRVAAITESAMRGEIAFEPALKERVALLKGLPLSVIQDVIDQRITVTPGARELVATMRLNGAYTCLVSGGFTVFTKIIAQQIGFHEHRSNTLGVTDQILDGTVHDPIVGKATKLATLLELRDHLHIAKSDSMAVGDGANDLAMLQEAGAGVAFHAKPAVAEAAHYGIRHSDLTALLYMQGYTQAEFAS